MTVACLDQTLDSPAANLACDQALLDERSAQGPDGIAVLRFWESATCFVVVGFANKVVEEVHQDRCRAGGVPVLRRCSGGGTVLQGPGCLNYALVLPIAEGGPLATVTATNRFVLERHRAALAGLLGQPVTIEGCTDLALRGRKFSGNAQRRQRDWLLYHGTVLLQFDLERIARFLRPPPRPPDYRQGRSHDEFLTTLPASAAEVKAALNRAWSVAAPPPPLPARRIASLVQARYERDEWNLCR